MTVVLYTIAVVLTIRWIIVPTWRVIAAPASTKPVNQMGLLEWIVYIFKIKP